jgi:hypothetical protein
MSILVRQAPRLRVDQARGSAQAQQAKWLAGPADQRMALRLNHKWLPSTLNMEPSNLRAGFLTFNRAG